MDAFAARKFGFPAGTMVSLAAAVFTQTHPNLEQNHPYLVSSLYATAFVFCVFAALQWPWVQKFLGIHREPLPPSHPSPPSAPATATASIGAVTFAPVFNNQTGTRMAVNGELLDGTRLIPTDNLATHGGNSPIGVSGDNSVTAGRDVKQITAGRDYTETHNHYPAQPIDELPEQLAAMFRDQKEAMSRTMATPSLKLRLEFKDITYDFRMGGWREVAHFDNDSNHALIAWFTNPLPPKNRDGIKAAALSAHIRFSAVEKHWEEKIPRAYWLGHPENAVNLEIGHEAGVVIGSVEGPYWVSYSNPYSNSAQNEILRLVGGKKQMPKSDMHVELSLISKDSRTIEQKVINLVFSSGVPHAVVHP
jgi:muconolactone delta-isomerase